MESRTILMLASVAMILVVAGIGNAFATVWYPLYPLASEDHGTYVTWLTSGPAKAWVPAGDDLGIGNQFFNCVTYPDKANLNYLGTYPSGELTLYTSPVDIPADDYRNVGFSGPTAGHADVEFTITANHVYTAPYTDTRASTLCSSLKFQEYLE